MGKKQNIWKPSYTINSDIARALMEIEAAKAVVENTPLSPAVEAELRYKARVRSTHYSTSIEGNRLTLKEAEQVIQGKKTHFHGRERDVKDEALTLAQKVVEDTANRSRAYSLSEIYRKRRTRKKLMGICRSDMKESEENPEGPRFQ